MHVFSIYVFRVCLVRMSTAQLLSNKGGCTKLPHYYSTANKAEDKDVYQWAASDMDLYSFLKKSTYVSI